MQRREVTVIAKAINDQRKAVMARNLPQAVREVAIDAVHDTAIKIAAAIKIEYPSFRDDLFIKAALLD